MNIKTITITAVHAMGNHPVVSVRGQQASYYFFKKSTEFQRTYTDSEPREEGQFPLAQARNDLRDIGNGHNDGSRLRIDWQTEDEHAEFLITEAARIKREEEEAQLMAKLRADIEEEQRRAVELVENLRVTIQNGTNDHPNAAQILKLVDEGMSAREAVQLFPTAEDPEPETADEENTPPESDKTPAPKPDAGPKKKRTPSVTE